MHRVLVVDDVEDNVFWLQTLLETEGYEVATASSGWAALDLVESLHPNLVLLDILLADMIGYAVTERIRQNPNLSETRIVLITASSVLERDEAVEAGADAFMRRPLDPDQVLAIVKDLCNQTAER
ncbi:MAG: response regulator [Oscillatoriophycideae cyanobacterium NC_groundwater_1537_Pr4_S-0.65um_50_18]|nr:response regulator [Oscillatoriophycideae cyanobacterium NC_groundwater_1537_Pr4_S-0.65um_50_18]